MFFRFLVLVSISSFFQRLLQRRIRRPIGVVHFRDVQGAYQSTGTRLGDPGFGKSRSARHVGNQRRAIGVPHQTRPSATVPGAAAGGADPAKIQLFRLTGSGMRKPYSGSDSWKTAPP